MNIGFQEIVVILILIIILFGPDKIPEIARAFGRAYKEFMKALNETKEQINEIINNSDESNNKSS
jgi:sec-independent protein translocase protein TatA